MKSSDLIDIKNNNLINFFSNNWAKLTEPQKNFLKKFWNVITYKWQLQILLNLPFLIWWVLDSKLSTVHTFDMKLINFLNLPDWVLSMIGFS